MVHRYLAEPYSGALRLLSIKKHESVHGFDKK